jgi:hypothetical protein
MPGQQTKTGVDAVRYGDLWRWCLFSKLHNARLNFTFVSKISYTLRLLVIDLVFIAISSNLESGILRSGCQSASGFALGIRQHLGENLEEWHRESQAPCACC